MLLFSNHKFNFSYHHQVDISHTLLKYIYGFILEANETKNKKFILKKCVSHTKFEAIYDSNVERTFILHIYRAHNRIFRRHFEHIKAMQAFLQRSSLQLCCNNCNFLGWKDQTYNGSCLSSGSSARFVGWRRSRLGKSYNYAGNDPWNCSDFNSTSESSTVKFVWHELFYNADFWVILTISTLAIRKDRKLISFSAKYFIEIAT